MAKKTYSRSVVFGGKDVPVLGIDQGKSIVYRGRSVQFCLNMFYDVSLQPREGQDKDSQYNESIIVALKGTNSKVVNAGKSLYAIGR